MIHRTDLPLTILISDLHCGSVWGLHDPEFRTEKGGGFILNQYQKWLWGWWQDFVAWVQIVTAGDPFCVVVNGDLLEGAHHGTTELLTNDTSEHPRMAVQLLQPLCDMGAKLFMVAGTECHTKNSEFSIAHALSATRAKETGSAAHEKLWLEQCGLLMAITHHIGTTSRIALEATQLSLQLAEEQAQQARIGGPIPRMVVRSHRHVYGYFSDGDGAALVTPSWQFLTRHGMKVVPAARLKFGGAILDWRNVGRGSLPEVRERLYRYRVDGDPQHAHLSAAEIEAAVWAKDGGGSDAAVGA